MPKKFFSQISRQYRENEQAWYLHPFRFMLEHPAYFHVSRRGVAGGLWLGLFCAFLPIPFQTVVAVLAALLFRVNIPSAAVGVWLTNPVTMGPIFFGAYQLGCQLMGIPAELASFTLDADNWLQSVGAIWKPLMLGSLTLGIVTASTGYLIVSMVWRVSTRSRFRRRHLRP